MARGYRQWSGTESGVSLVSRTYLSKVSSLFNRTTAGKLFRLGNPQILHDYGYAGVGLVSLRDFLSGSA